MSTQKAVAETLVDFRDRHYVKSTIFITHDLSLVYQIADSVIVMYAGRLAEKAPTDALVASRATPTPGCWPPCPRSGSATGPAGWPASPRPPSLLDPPRGCRFRDRCPLAFDKCATQPPFTEVAPDHHVACWKASWAMLRLEGVSKTYRVGTFGGRELVAVSDVNLEVRPGQVISSSARAAAARAPSAA